MDQFHSAWSLVEYFLHRFPENEVVLLENYHLKIYIGGCSSLPPPPPPNWPRTPIITHAITWTALKWIIIENYKYAQIIYHYYARSLEMAIV